ncbi:hypothetical protein PV04_06481 [Phialophora macrospora]|uniref:Vacuolar ATPase assembly protein VMA22 n=1 Tax=Phialophora macrospora TaxID=1851006 RepID=A0A0D2G5C1_9EURO|nr:hypothetical protein PV04_06481 [Phialophora macrospora]
MASKLLSPPDAREISSDSSSKPQTIADGGEALSSRLDALLIEYLSLLDAYITLRARLGKDFSSGFFALAQANRHANSTLGAGRRYGEEGYDDRMKARRVVGFKRRDRIDRDRSGQEIESKAATQRIQLSDKEDQSEVNQKQQAPVSPIDCPEQDSGNPGPQQQVAEDGISVGMSLYAHHLSIEALLPPPKDPIRWYGILIPPALRTCQNHFTSAVSSVIPELLNTILSLRHVEEEIWIIRRDLDIIDESKYTEADNEDEEASNNNLSPEDHEPEKSFSAPGVSSRRKASTTKNPSTLLSASSAGLPPQPRCRVLKLE